MIAERPKRIHPQVDLQIGFQCGCTVVFLGSCFHRSTRLDPCRKHDGKNDVDKRTAIVEEAKRQYRDLELNQPPM